MSMLASTSCEQRDIVGSVKSRAAIDGGDGVIDSFDCNGNIRIYATELCVTM
jgi:hypothetical protein